VFLPTVICTVTLGAYASALLGHAARRRFACSVDDESDAENVTRNEARAFAERRRRPLRLITGSRFANEKIDFGVLRFPGARYRHDVGRMQ